MPARPTPTAAGRAATEAAAAAELFARVAADADLCRQLDVAATLIVEALRTGHKVITCGNGGSAADANHLAEELVGRYHLDREPLPAICLNVDGGAMTCIANDYGYEGVFARQVRAFGRPGDVLIVFSTSGNSPNILRALEEAAQMSVATVALLGKGGGRAREMAGHALVVPSTVTARIQEVHGLFLHIACEAVDAAFSPAKPGR